MEHSPEGRLTVSENMIVPLLRGDVTSDSPSD